MNILETLKRLVGIETEQPKKQDQHDPWTGSSAP